MQYIYNYVYALFLQVMYKTLNPKWNQTLEFPDDGSPLMLHVKDHNALLPTSSIGDCVVEYQRLPPNEKSDKWIPLQGVKKGEIHVQVTRKIPELRPRSSFDSESSSTKSHLINTQVEKHLTQHFNLLFIASPQSPPLPHPPKPNKRKKKTHTHTHEK